MKEVEDLTWVRVFGIDRAMARASTVRFSIVYSLNDSQSKDVKRRTEVQNLV